jgi:hypothetical protein
MAARKRVIPTNPFSRNHKFVLKNSKEYFNPVRLHREATHVGTILIPEATSHAIFHAKNACFVATGVQACDLNLAHYSL